MQLYITNIGKILSYSKIWNDINNLITINFKFLSYCINFLYLNLALFFYI